MKTSFVQYFLRKNRATEEKALVENEMKNTLEYWERQKVILEDERNNCETSVKVLFCEKIEYVKRFIKDLRILFKNVIPLEMEEELSSDEEGDDVDLYYGRHESSSSSDEDDDEGDSDEDVEVDGFYV